MKFPPTEIYLSTVTVTDPTPGQSGSLDQTIDKVYIDGPCGFKKFAGVLLARFERVSHLTHSYKYDQ